MAIKINREEMPGTVIEAKRWWRSRIRSALADTGANYRSEASAAIRSRATELIDELEGEHRISTVLVYSPVGTEVDTRGLTEELIRAGKRVCLPVCTDWDEDGIRAGTEPEMEARVVTDLSELVAGAYNIPEPPRGSACADAEEIDLIILPCLSCDVSCRRIGHGEGYYDRYISLTRDDCFKIALCYEAVLADALPSEEHDIVMDAVVTEAAVYRWRGQTGS